MGSRGDRGNLGALEYPCEAVATLEDDEKEITLFQPCFPESRDLHLRLARIQTYGRMHTRLLIFWQTPYFRTTCAQTKGRHSADRGPRVCDLWRAIAVGN